jgi:hypothetical protein
MIWAGAPGGESHTAVVHDAPMTCGRIVLPMGEIARRYDAGESTAELGRAYAVSDEVIRVRLVEHGVTLHGHREAAVQLGAIPRGSLASELHFP